MKAITLWQPWASFVAIGDKSYETRSWAPPRCFIGQRIAIHAAKKKMSGEEEGWWLHTSGERDLPPLGAIVCTVLLRGAYLCGRHNEQPSTPIIASKGPERKDNLFPDDYGDYSFGRWAWWLTDVERFDPPIPAKGSQGFWEWADNPPQQCMSGGK